MSNDLDDKLKNISNTCKHYLEPMVLCGKTLRYKCEHYTGGLDEKLEHSCICCFNLQTLDGKYDNRKDKVLDSDDIMQLYKTDSVGFLIYFSINDNCDKVRILRDIFESDFVNEEVIAWLEKNELDIMREASFTENWAKKQF